MEKYISGAVFCLIAAMIRGTKYISAALFMAGNASQSRELFASGLKYIGSEPDITAALALACGILLISWGIMDSCKHNRH